MFLVKFNLYKMFYEEEALKNILFEQVFMQFV